MIAPIVVKLGGSAGIDPAPTLDDLASLWPAQPVIFVHGANAALDAYVRQQGREPLLVTSTRGQVSRFTDQQAMDDFLAIYAGQTNKRLVEGFHARGVNAVGLTGMDGGIVQGRRKSSIRIVENGKQRVLRGDYAGSITDVDTTLLDMLLANEFLPVLTPPAVSDQGEAINVDGDKMALQIAIAMQASALILMSNTAGLLANVDDPGSLINRINISDPTSTEGALIAAEGRMKKKVEAGVNAVQAGISQVIFADARIDRPVSQALAGVGTVVGGGPEDGPHPKSLSHEAGRGTSRARPKM